MAKVWNTTYQVLGSVDDDGKIWNTTYQVLGSVDDDGKIWNTTYQVLGSVDGGTRKQRGGAAFILLFGA